MAAIPVTTKVTELPESRVRVEAEIPPEEIERRVVTAAKQIGRDLRIPGFRKGKVPPPVIVQRMGRQAVLDEAVRESIGSWYAAAIGDAGIRPVGDPDLDLGSLPEAGESLTFTIEIGVRPTAELGEYKGLEVGRREAEVDEDEVEQELTGLQDRMARLETVERAAGKGDFVVIDFLGTIDGEPFAGGEARDQMLELGSGKLVPGFEDQLEGAEAGEQRTVDITFPDDYGSDELKGKAAQFAVTVSEVKEKQLPELNDELAADAAGFDTLDELREDIRTRLAERQNQLIERDFRETVLKAAVANATIDVPEQLIDARAHDLWHDLQHSLSHQGISKDIYLQISGKTEEQVLEEAKPDAEDALRREAVLTAIVAAESVEVEDDEVLDAVVRPEEREKVKKPEKLLRQLRDSGRYDEVREDLAARKALDLIVEAATSISVEQAKARELLWTPESDEAEKAPSQLWTPGS